MKLELLEYYVQVVESRSFNQAAKHLFITQPALTVAMNNLEEEVNLKLLKRSNKGVIPTATGLEFYHDCKEILDLISLKQEKWRRFLHTAEELTGNVYILALPAMFSFILNDLVIDLKTTYPKVNIFLKELPKFDILSELQTSNTNIGLSACFLSEKEEFNRKAQALDLNFEILCEDWYDIFMSSNNPYVRKKELSIEDCADLATVVLSSDLVVAPRVKHLFSPDKVYYLSSKESMFQFIAEDKAVGGVFRENAL